MKPLSWDTTAPLHANSCDRVSSLLAAAGARDHLMAGVVAQELTELGAIDAVQYFSIDPLDSMEGLAALAAWMLRMGSSADDGHDVGEAGAEAVAELRGAIAVIDDRHARQVAHRYLIEYHGSLWAISQTVVHQTLGTPNAHSGLCDRMLSTGIRWPFEAGGYPAWFERHKKELTE